MGRISILLSLAACLAFPLCAVEADAERLANDYKAALEVRYVESPELGLFDALGRLREKPDSAADFERVRAMAESDTTDSGLAPILDTMVLLNRAVEGDFEGYKIGFAKLRKASSNAKLLKLADVSETLVVCSECGGKPSCEVCGDGLKCPACKGRGFSVSRAPTASAVSSSRSLGGSSLATSGGSQRLRCAECKGTGKCPACHGVRKVCSSCRNAGKMPDPGKVNARIAQLAGFSADHLSKTLKAEIEARAETARLADELRKAQGISDPKAALEMLSGLPQERALAAQWSHAATVRADLEALVKVRSDNSAEKNAQRTALRAAVAQAQRAPDPLKGMEALLPVFVQYADCDALPEAKTAFDGLAAAARNRLSLQAETLSDRVSAIGALVNPADRVAQANACLSDWPTFSVPKVLRDYAKVNGRTDLEHLFGDSRLASLRDTLEGLRAAASKAQAEVEAKPAWWIWAAIGFGVLVAVYFLWSLIQGLLERRAEAARKARQKAALDSIRNTFSHRRGS